LEAQDSAKNKRGIDRGIARGMSEINIKIFNDLIDSISQRLQAVINAKGEATKY
jgi:hypothetical protein